MNWVDGFRDPTLARKIVDDIHKQVSPVAKKLGRPLQIMEVCGGHTHTLFKYGIPDLFKDVIEFAHGPGCPVCVLPVEVIDDCYELVLKPSKTHITSNPKTQNNVILTTFGDAMRVPGKYGSLLMAKAQGADIRMVYSPLDALEIAKKNPDHEVVFLGLGFDTTMPSTAMTVKLAKEKNLENFSLYCAHITIIPTLRSLLEGGQINVDGFIGPGHVSMVIGTKPYEFIPNEFNLPFVVAGFEPIDLLQSLALVVDQIANNEAKVENQYKRSVLTEGNCKAIETLNQVFQPDSGFDWRGLGQVKDSGVRLGPEYSDFDAQEKFQIGRHKTTDPLLTELGLCSQVITGEKKPKDCPLFDRGCNPNTPVGALMVSNEGACAAYYQYSRDQQVMNYER